MRVLLFLLAMFVLCYPAFPANPHQPAELTWTVTDTSSGEILKQESAMAPPGTWYPPLEFEVQDLFLANRDRHQLREKSFYVCPGHKTKKSWHQQCGGAESYFCASWKCVSTGPISWTPPVRDDLITVRRGIYDMVCGSYGRQKCNPLRIEFTDQGKQILTEEWITGKTWGIQIYDGPGPYFGPVPGALFTIRLEVQTNPPGAIGHNPVLVPQEAPVTRPPGGHRTPVHFGTTPQGQDSSYSRHPLWNLVSKTFQVINASKPDLTKECWLCLMAQPPFYVSIAIAGDYTSVSPKSCPWGRQGKISLQEVTGMGTCAVAPRSQAPAGLCNQTITIQNNTFYSTSAGWWVCTSGLTPCIHGTVLNKGQGFCVMVQLFPNMKYYTEAQMELALSPIPARVKRATGATAVLLSSLMGMGMAGAMGVGISALMLQDRNYQALQAAINSDLRNIEQSILKLEASLDSLAEVALQNRRGLDLLLMQQGGLCAALGEDCCFYVNHSGVIRDSMTLLRKRINDREEIIHAKAAWYENLFNWSSQSITFLVLAVLFIIILISGVCIGCCLFKRLKAFCSRRGKECSDDGNEVTALRP